MDVQANYAQSKIKADYASVNEQSGIFSGNDGYNININDKTTLNGAVISSSQKAVDEGKANFKTSSLQTSDIQNIADYSADGFGISAGASLGESGSATPDKNGKPTGVRGSDKTLGVSKSIGYGSDSDSQATTTKSGIITSDKESEYAGKLDNNFDKTKVQNEIDTSVRVTQSFDATRQSVKQEINKEIEEANKVLNDPKVSQSDTDKANEKIAEMQKVGLLVDTINGALYNPADTLAGTAVNTLSPAVVYKVGQYFKENEELNKLDGGNRDEQGSTKHLLAQALVAGVTAGLAGNDILSSTISGGGGEAIAPYLAEYIYGVNPKDVSTMTAEQKQTISTIISLGSMAVGATSGSVTDMVASGEAGTVAVEENGFSVSEFYYKIEKTKTDLVMLRKERVKALKKGDIESKKLAEELNEEIKKDLAILDEAIKLGNTPEKQIENLNKIFTKHDADGIKMLESILSPIAVEETASLISQGKLDTLSVEVLLNSVKTPKVIKDKIQKAISYTKQYKIEIDPNVISVNGLGGIKIVKKKEIEYIPLKKPKNTDKAHTIFGEKDHLGRPTGVTATITKSELRTGSDAKQSIRPPGYITGREPHGHARGHLLGNVLGGSGKDEKNLVTLYQNSVNSPTMRSFERDVKIAIEKGEVVNYRVVPIYKGNNLMPIGVTMSATGSNAFKLNVSIPNIKKVIK